MKEKYIEDLKEIKDIMNRSSRFLSLSGLSGITAGVIALAGAYIANLVVFSNENYLGFQRTILDGESLSELLLIATATLLVAIGTTLYFTNRETQKRNQKIWDNQSKRLLINLLIPLVTGGILCTIFIFQGFLGIAIPLTLIFYGLSLVNASKYTLDEVRSLGLIEIVLGLITLFFIEYGLIFWSVGFGVLHIIYGIIMQRKNKS